MSALVVLAACRGELTGSGGPGQQPIGALRFGLLIGDGVEIVDVRYRVTRSGDAFERSGSVSYLGEDSSAFSAILSLPAANDYHLLLEAHATDGAVCSGEADFDVDAGHRTAVSVTLRCPTDSDVPVDVSGVLNVCPRVEAVTAHPAEALVGETIALSVSASDSDEGPLALLYRWTNNLGIFSDPTSASPTLECAAAGVAQVTVLVSDGDPGCELALNFLVTCLSPPLMPVDSDPSMMLDDDTDGGI